jgi:hypothetical protein
MHFLLGWSIMGLGAQKDVFKICHRIIYSGKIKIIFISILFYFYAITQHLQKPIRELVQSD